MTHTNVLVGQVNSDNQVLRADEDPNPRTSHLGLTAGAGQDIPDGQMKRETQKMVAVGDPKQLNGQRVADTQRKRAVEHLTPQPTIAEPVPMAAPSVGALDSGDQNHIDTQGHRVAALVDLRAQATWPSKSRVGAPGLADPLLALAADVLDDLERVRIANENRLRQLTRDTEDKDGKERGFGLTLDHPDVARLAALVDALSKAEHDATLNLQRMVRRHPLGPWIKSAKGVGEKQGARLLAAIRDPYWNDLYDRPRTVSELWAFAGYHVIKLPGGQIRAGAQNHLAAGDPTSARQGRFEPHETGAGGGQSPTNQSSSDAHTRTVGGDLTGNDVGYGLGCTQPGNVGVAAARARGMKANWSATAKMRARLISESIVKAGGPYREVYDKGRAKYADSVHAVECKRCGPAGKPAQPGSALSDGHKHARALRLVSKAILRDLWIEAKRVHEVTSGEAGAYHVVLPKPDPVPHYNRGRTFIEPDDAS